MRPPVDGARIRTLARELGRVARAPVVIYLTGGSTAVLEGWRETTVDVDLRFEPEAEELMRALPDLKERLGINIELASPPDFIPELPGWRERSPLLFSEGLVSFHHFDPYSQALSKIERGFKHDLSDLLHSSDATSWIPGACASSMTRSSPSCTDIPRSSRRRSGES